jgi:hypothetical protein
VNSAPVMPKSGHETFWSQIFYCGVLAWKKLQYTNKEIYGQIFLSVKNSNSKVSLRYQSITYNSTKKIMIFLSKEMKTDFF